MRCICFFNSNIPWGGGENWHLNAARSFAARGWRVLLVCRPDSELYRRAASGRHGQSVAPDPGGALEILALGAGRLSFLNPFLHLRLKRLFRDKGIEALIMNLPADLKLAGPAARAAGVRHIVYRRGSALPVRDSLLNRLLFGRVITRFIANSRATLEQALVNNQALIPPERTSILSNSVDIADFDRKLAAAAPLPFFNGAGGALDEEKAEGAAQFPAGPPANGPGRPGPPRRPFIIGNAGRLTRQKGQHLLLRLAARLQRAGLDFRLVIAGEGEREGELKALAQELGVEELVLFAGFMADLSPFWRGIDLFVLSSLWEGFGNVIIEAMLAQKPVFAFKVSNIPELVDESNGGLFPLPAEERGDCPDPRPESRSESWSESWSDPGPESRPEASARAAAYAELELMAQAILELAADPAKRKALGEAGRRSALRFSQESRMDELEDLLNQNI